MLAPTANSVVYGAQMEFAHVEMRGLGLRPQLHRPETEAAVYSQIWCVEYDPLR